MNYYSDSVRQDSHFSRPPPAYPGPPSNIAHRNGYNNSSNCSINSSDGYNNLSDGYNNLSDGHNKSSNDYSKSIERLFQPVADRYQPHSDGYQSTLLTQYPSSTDRYAAPDDRYNRLRQQLDSDNSYLSTNLPPPYNGYQESKMNMTREYPPTSRDYGHVRPDTSEYLGKPYPGTMSRNLANARRIEMANRELESLNGQYPLRNINYVNDRDYQKDINYPLITRDYDENNVRDYSSSTNNSDILDLAREMDQRDSPNSREQTIPRDQSLSGFSRNFGTGSRDFRISRESLDRPNPSDTPPSRQSQTPPSFHSSTPPLRHSQASPIRQQTPPDLRTSQQTPLFRTAASNHQSHPSPSHTPPYTRDPTARYSMSPKSRYRTAEEYHYNYRGGYRPADSEGDSTLCGGERQPFLSNVEPVRLTPSWEQSNLPKEELNFKNVHAFETFDGDTDPPSDRLALVFMTLTLHGVGTLMPWNMFITAYSYFVDYKLVDEFGEKTDYANDFLSYVGYASQLPNVIFNWLNIFVQIGGGTTCRIVGSIMVEVVLFIVTVVLAMVDSSNWQGAFFWTTMGCIVVINIANGIYQNTVYGMAARLPFKYTGAVILGSNISGTFTAIINIVALLLAPNLRTSAIYYFITALFVLLACFDTYFALPLNRFFRYHEAQYEKAQKASSRQAASSGLGKPRVPHWFIFKKAFPQLLNVFMVFFVTLAVFPAVLADTCRTEEGFFIPTYLYQAITCYLTFNLFAMLGNMLPGLFMWPGPRFLCIPVFLRLLLVPCFLFCHYYPINRERIMPVLIDSDWAYWVLSVVLGITSGYYSSLAMMYCPRTVEPEHAPVAGMMAAASLITGIFAGINFQMVCSWLVTHVTFDVPGLEFPTRNCTV